MSFGEESGEEQGKQNFKYNGKELDKEHGLNQYDYAARFMDPSMVRFTTVDPLAEKYYSISPYAYVGNNPMKFVDKDGRQTDFPPPGFFGTPDQFSSIVFQQQAQSISIDAARPSATGAAITVGAASGASTSKTYSLLLILRGNDTGRVGLYKTNGSGMGTPDLSITFNGLTVYSSDPKSFTKEQIAGDATQTSTSIAGANVTYSKAESEEGTQITTVGAGLAMGLSKSVSGGSVEKINTQETIISIIINSIIDFFQEDEH